MRNRFASFEICDFETEAHMMKVNLVDEEASRPRG